MPRHEWSYGGPNFTRRDLVRSLRHLPLTAEPRTRFQYCNMMFVTMAYAIETVTGQWLGDFLRERVWEPLGMESTFFALSDAKKAVEDGKAKIAKGYKWEEQAEAFCELEWMEARELSGAGGVISTVLDYAQWMKMMLNQAQPLSKQGHQALTDPRIVAQGLTPPFDAPSLYALGWEVTTYHGESVIFHDGGLIGFGTELLLLPNSNWGIVLMGNTAQTSNYMATSLMYHLFDEFLGVPQEERFDWEEKLVFHALYPVSISKFSSLRDLVNSWLSHKQHIPLLTTSQIPLRHSLPQSSRRLRPQHPLSQHPVPTSPSFPSPVRLRWNLPPPRLPVRDLHPEQLDLTLLQHQHLSLRQHYGPLLAFDDPHGAR